MDSWVNKIAYRFVATRCDHYNIDLEKLLDDVVKLCP